MTESGQVVVYTKLETCKRLVVDTRRLIQPQAPQDAILEQRTQVFRLEDDWSSGKAQPTMAMTRFMRQRKATAAMTTPAQALTEVEEKVSGSAAVSSSAETEVSSEAQSNPEKVTAGGAANPPQTGGEDLADESTRNIFGQWMVIPEQSDPLEAFLKEIGVPWVARKVIGNLQMTTTLSLEPGGWFVVHDRSSAGESTTRMRADATFHEVVGSDKKSSPIRCQVDRGASLEWLWLLL